MAGKRPHHISLPHLVHQRQCKVDKISFYEGIYFIFSILKGPAVSGSFTGKCCMTGDLVRRLGLFQELEGHTVCVNCIQVGFFIIDDGRA